MFNEYLYPLYALQHSSFHYFSDRVTLSPFKRPSYVLESTIYDTNYPICVNGTRTLLPTPNVTSPTPTIIQRTECRNITKLGKCKAPYQSAKCQLSSTICNIRFCPSGYMCVHNSVLPNRIGN